MSHYAEKLARKTFYERRMCDVLRSKIPPCLNCGERQKHFVVPSFGEPGFYICKHKVAK